MVITYFLSSYQETSEDQIQFKMLVDNSSKVN